MKALDEQYNQTGGDEDFINYIITVHGIGDQIYNETVLPVINGFGRVLHNHECNDDKASSKKPLNKKKKDNDLVTLGMVNSQTGTILVGDGEVRFKRQANNQVWAEFQGIPNSAEYNPSPEFNGSPPKDNDIGKNMRFVDMYWADILEADASVSVQPVEKWIESILGRIDELKDNGTEGAARKWLKVLLQELTKLILFLNSFLSYRFSDLHKVIFNKYLSDVQVYAEHRNVRGSAVTRFHRMMEKIHNTHYHFEEEEGAGAKKKKPRYIIIAHSLGSVLAADALCYAAYLNNSGFKDHESFPSYGLKENDIRSQPDLTWLDHVQTLVTLGSPIDKYIALWPDNYTYLNKAIPKLANRIRHLNYCDEQDPVGHKLNLFRAQKSYDSLFISFNVSSTKHIEKEVYERYPIPGKAHTDYWGDYPLFDHIINTGIKKNPVKKNLENDKTASRNGVIITYLIVPVLAMVALSIIFLIGYSKLEGFKEDWLDALLPFVVISVGFMALAYFFHRLIKLMVYWRQILIAKGEEEGPTTQGKRKTVYEKSRSKRIRFYRYAILSIMLLACFSLSAPTMARWQDQQWLYLSIYVISLVATYWFFLWIRKKIVPPTTSIIKEPKNYSWLKAFALVVLPTAISVLTFYYFKWPSLVGIVIDEAAIGIVMATGIWAQVCMLVEEGRKQMKELLNA